MKFTRGSMEVAMNVLKIVKREVHKIKRKRPHDYLSLIAFNNGREQGLGIIVGGNLEQRDFDKRFRTVWFARQRSSDDIIVYHENGYHDKGPTDAGWDNHQCFRYHESEKAGKYISDMIKGFLYKED